MDESKILDAVCILPRIELFGEYLEQEIDQLENYLRRINADEFMINHCDRIRQLMWISEEVSQKVFHDVNKMMGCE